MSQDWSKQYIGLWVRQSQYGEYLSFRITIAKMLPILEEAQKNGELYLDGNAFENTKKSKPTQPDYSGGPKQKGKIQATTPPPEDTERTPF